MYIFTESTRARAAAGEATSAPPAYELQDVALKEQLPFEELVVVAGLQTPPHDTTASNAAESPLRQLTCLSARVKPWGRRVLLVLPIPVVADDRDALVQILDMGEAAVAFAQDVRSCFPTLVRRSPMAYAAPDSDDESGDDDQDMEDDEETKARSKKRLDDQHLEDQQQQLVKAEQQRKAHAFMDRTRVKVLMSLEELFHAFQIQNQTQVRLALLQDGETSNSQWLCVDLSALATQPSRPHSAVSGSDTCPHNFGLIVSHVASVPPKSLVIPIPRPPRGFFVQTASTSADADDEDEGHAEVFQDVTVLSLGAKREATSHGGGKTPEEMVKNIRMRHASGTFCTLVEPATTWDGVVAKYEAFLPQVRELRGELRLRRIMGPARNEPVMLLLER